ncbi:unnamed protein product [Rotaria magnacalcarata]|uniref:Helitron helicase-like domain-containing protein n=1 Tax=Rotaria magnacalcarata TaxID=392030 RepID=A0A820FH82_9BILA|nr:unnamed protein product [Rotaria magnacalcarata]CAF2270611.1 unnamed protein product [Rotaria magnacalcarata]CAF4218038.1 unnamed protein product [Rotaria magnacalcarata]CAF4262136.1 unnamed protein product [Rotaria magnacalcarata]
MSFLKDTETSDVERSGYVDNDINPDELCLNGVVSLNMSALIDTSSMTISSNDVRHHLKLRTNITNEITNLNDNIYLVPHEQYPVNEYFNTSFFARSQATEINKLTAKEVNIALDQIESNSSERTLNPRLSALLKQLKTISGSVMGSNQSRANYRVEFHAQIFFSGLQNIYITINPCDLHHPLTMKFAGVDLDIDNLTADLMPKSHERAAIVSNHPVGIARFFNKLITTVLSTLINYNINKHESYPGGGILDEIEAHYGTVEESGRSALHLHILL